MRKIIFGLLAVLLAFAVKAEYLSWYVGSTSNIGGTTRTSGTEAANYYTAKLYWTTTATSTGGAWLDTISPTPDSSVATLSGDSYGDGVYYYVELYNYDNSVVATSEATTYASLVESGAISKTLTALSSVNYAWNGTATVATPEPTSGLLMLMGFAMLGLKRKKEV